MTAALQEIFGELSSLSPEKQQVAASVIHALWIEEHAEKTIDPEFEAELDKRSAEIREGKVDGSDPFATIAELRAELKNADKAAS